MKQRYMVNTDGQLHERHGPHARAAYDNFVGRLADEAKLTPKCWHIFFGAVGHVDLEVQIAEADDPPTTAQMAEAPLHWDGEGPEPW